MSYILKLSLLLLSIASFEVISRPTSSEFLERAYYSGSQAFPEGESFNFIYKIFDSINKIDDILPTCRIKRHDSEKAEIYYVDLPDGYTIAANYFHTGPMAGEIYCSINSQISLSASLFHRIKNLYEQKNNVKSQEEVSDEDVLIIN